MDTVQPEDPSQISTILGREVKLYFSAPPNDVGHGNAYLVIEGHTIPFHTSEHGIHCGSTGIARAAPAASRSVAMASSRSNRLARWRGGFS